MKQSNTKILTKDELDFLNNKYQIEYKDNLLFIKANTINRAVCHNLDDKFTIVFKKDGVIRFVKISPEATKMWVNNYKDTSYSLFDVQNAINVLIISFQQVTKDDVDSVLKNHINNERN